MAGLNNLPRQWTSSDYVTTTDLTGTGTDIVESDGIDIFPESISITDYLIEIIFEQQRTAGTGNAKTWAAIYNYQGDDAVLNNTVSGTFFTGVLSAQDTKRTRIIRLKPSVLQSLNSIDVSSVRVRISASGSAANTEFAVTNIKARLIYLPL